MNKALILPDQSEVQQMSEQCKSLMVGGRALTPTEGKALAILAVSIGLNPFLGEIFFIPGSGPFVGIKGQRRNAKNQLGEDDHVFPPIYILRVAGEYGGLEGDICYECELRDSKSIKEFASMYKMMAEILGDNQALLSEVVGHSPTTHGIGIVTAAEIETYQNLDPKKRKTAMTPTARAKKRAEADAYRQRFPIGASIGLADINGDIPEIQTQGGEVIDVEPVEVKVEKQPPLETEPELEVEEPVPTSPRGYFHMAYSSPFFSKKDADLVKSVLNACNNDPQKAWGVLMDQHVHPEDKKSGKPEHRKRK